MTASDSATSMPHLSTMVNPPFLSMKVCVRNGFAKTHQRPLLGALGLPRALDTRRFSSTLIWLDKHVGIVLLKRAFLHNGRGFRVFLAPLRGGTPSLEKSSAASSSLHLPPFVTSFDMVPSFVISRGGVSARTLTLGSPTLPGVETATSGPAP